MKNCRTMLVLAGLMLLVGTVGMLAQNTWNGQDFEAKFTAPMAFYAGDKLLPAGTYEMKQGAMQQGQTLQIIGKGKDQTVFLQYTAINSNIQTKEINVSFRKYGNKEFLGSIQWPGQGGGATTQTSWILKIEPSATEQAAAKAAQAAEHKVSATSTKKQ